MSFVEVLTLTHARNKRSYKQEGVKESFPLTFSSCLPCILSTPKHKILKNSLF